ncbi:D-alanine-D-alanine ligase [Pseudonocardia autotrophica]|uniref:D-alanine--D-alanine ligase n=2 Tax=Pseudonocardia TaxID=1847 RepID=A0A1Y2MPY5_PSEAH|nr:D-alanine--D-alanine ligase [Pseudonocardia autotrophica]TDN74842.1 D-alanine-D-alanine ligase [Pseudonocardia autotrophica]BBG05617.1 D-alanine--D-alanine ligase [Pseudonocardia autotrophica]GEC25868.1 D-alanine--D-alanine ligase [Pseudonocardia saturnea]
MEQNARVSDRTVAVLAGGLSHEREVSLRSGRRLAGALRANGVDVREWDVDGALLGRLSKERPDVVAVALHGGEGENGAVQQILELLHIPFVGTPSGACRRAWDKPSVKAELVRAGLTTPDWVALPHSTFRELGAQGVLGAIVERLGLPLVLKPDQGGSALGVQVVRDAAELPAAMVSSFAYADTVLAERFVRGTEVAVSVVHDGAEPRALPAVEVEVPSGFYDYTCRYTPGAASFHCPARLPEDVLATLAETALAAHRLLGMRDVSRTDAIVDDEGRVHVLEMNVSPGLTDTSLLPTAVTADGSDLATVYQALVERAASRPG